MPIDIEHDDIATALKKLKAKEDTFRQIESIINLGSWEVDLLTGKSTWSKQSYIIYGEDESVVPSLELFLSHVIPEDLPRVQQQIMHLRSSKQPLTDIWKMKRKDSQRHTLLFSAQTLFNDKNQAIKIIGSTQDITEQVMLKQHAQDLSTIVDNSLNEIYIVDEQTYKYLYVNQGSCNALGYTKEELLSLSLFDINPHISQEEIDFLTSKIITEQSTVNRTVHQRKDGSLYYVQSFIHRIHYKETNAVVIFDIDISKQIEDELKLQEQAVQLTYQANHDSLTALPNRTLFQDRLEQAIALSKRHHKQFALFFIDLDQFKQINDSLGHLIGDQVLIETAQRLQKTIREEDTLARLGGDEFTIILKNIRTSQHAAQVAQKIVDIMKAPFYIKGHTLFVSSSIGISLYPQHSEEKDNLIKFADTAMYKAKEEGRDNYQFYTAEMTHFAFERVVMESSLRMAIDEDQFIVYFQPQYHIHTDKIIGMEALVRWNHPTLGLVPPDKFIPIAEESGLIIQIDQIVMHKAMKQVAQWYQDDLHPGILALNLSMKQLGDKEFITNLIQMMQEIQFDPQWLELEVTETQVMADPQYSINKLHKIHNLGIEIAIDDFGTGYSSLAYLKKLPLDKLKIDQSFVRDIPKEEDDMAIAKAIIALGKSLNLKLIAEGVETLEQKEFLALNGCEYVQGYFYSRPIPAQEFESLLRDSSQT